MRIMNGDHAEFEIEHANTKPEDRPDWPLPSFDARDWAKAFCKINPTMDEGTMITWFANALMRGYDEGQERAQPLVQALHEIAEPVQALQRKADAEGCQLDGAMANQLAGDAHYLRSIARVALSS